jgi:hypothetical protein
MISSCRRGGMDEDKVLIKVRFEIDSSGGKVPSRGLSNAFSLKLPPCNNLHLQSSSLAMDHDHGMHASDEPEARCKMWMLW